MILKGSELKVGTIIKGVQRRSPGRAIWCRFRATTVRGMGEGEYFSLGYVDDDALRFVSRNCYYKVVYR